MYKIGQGFLTCSTVYIWKWNLSSILLLSNKLLLLYIILFIYYVSITLLCNIFGNLGVLPETKNKGTVIQMDIPVTSESLKIVELYIHETDCMIKKKWMVWSSL